MKGLIIILLVLVIYGCILGMVNSYRIYKLKSYFSRTIMDFLRNYQRFQKVWDTDYDAETILRICSLENNFIKFGPLESMIFRNAKELRETMLLIGEFIIQYSESLNYYYGYQEDDEEYKCLLEVLREIRRICIQKGEKSTFNLIER